MDPKFNSLGFKDTPFESSYSNREILRFESKKKIPIADEVIGEDIHEVTEGENGDDRIESMT